MKRRGFLQALIGTVAAVFAPAVASKIDDDPGYLTEASLEDIIIDLSNRGSVIAIEPRRMVVTRPPETLGELRQVIEATYETVGELQQDATDYFVGWGSAPTTLTYFTDAKTYRGFYIIGKGNNERDAVADAFKTVSHELGGKELLWRRKLTLDVLRDFESGTNNYVVRGRACVLA